MHLKCTETKVCCYLFDCIELTPILEFKSIDWAYLSSILTYNLKGIYKIMLSVTRGHCAGQYSQDKRHFD